MQNLDWGGLNMVTNKIIKTDSLAFILYMHVYIFSQDMLHLLLHN